MSALIPKADTRRYGDFAVRPDIFPAASFKIPCFFAQGICLQTIEIGR
jgi:hypothetical protein